MTPQKIAFEYKWDGQSIFYLMCECLTECNYHTYREVLEAVWHGMECSDYQCSTDRMKLLLSVQKQLQRLIDDEVKQ